jgi:RNA-directed DNA polymerase
VSKAKPLSISKPLVWEAYKGVKANKGAVGVDEESIADFEVKLKDNLYKLWNRMSSGSYFPSPVRRVEIPKSGSGTRKLGIPTVSDRIAQTVVKMILELEVEPYFHWEWRVSVGGATTGFLIWTLRVSLTTSTTHF